MKENVRGKWGQIWSYDSFIGVASETLEKILLFFAEDHFHLVSGQSGKFYEVPI